MYWWQLINEYTRRSATFPTDRWEAIRGLATEVVETHAQKLLYGLWSHRIKYELLWTVERTGGQRINIGAPSWSWLSVTGAVELDQAHLITAPKHIDATIQSGEMSQVDSSTGKPRPYLAVSARMVPIRIDPCTPEGLRERRKYILMQPIKGSCSLDTTEEICDAYALQLFRRDYYPESNGLIEVADSEINGSWRRVGTYESEKYEPFQERYQIILV